MFNFLIMEPYMYYRLNELDFFGVIYLSQLIFNPTLKMAAYKHAETPQGIKFICRFELATLATLFF